MFRWNIGFIFTNICFLAIYFGYIVPRINGGDNLFLQSMLPYLSPTMIALSIIGIITSVVGIYKTLQRLAEEDSIK